MTKRPGTIKHLWLLRHGKAVPSGLHGGGDKDRPLTGRGRRDATAFGHRLAAGTGVFGLHDVPLPDVAICSAASRTRETADLVLGAMGKEIPLESFHSLYGASPATVLQYIRELDDSRESALVVGHNPTLYQLAWELLPPAGIESDDDDAGIGKGRSTLENHGFPTCALAVLRLEVASWGDVAPECGSLAGVVSPPY
jgi:phosphohistidine phosphatase